MVNNEFEKKLTNALGTQEIPNISLVINTKNKMYTMNEKKAKREEKVIILYMVTLISILISIELIFCLFTFKINPFLGGIVYITFISFVVIIAFMCYNYKKSIKKYLVN